MLRALAEAADAEGDDDAAVRYGLRLLGRDPHDDAAHHDAIGPAGSDAGGSG